MVECEAIHRPRSLPCHGDTGDTRTTWTDGTDGATRPGMAEARRTHGISAAHAMSKERHQGHRGANHHTIHPMTILGGPAIPTAQTAPTAPTSRTSTRRGKARACATPSHHRLNRPVQPPACSGV